MIPNNHDLFQKHDKTRYGDSPDHQNIFLPKLLRKESGDYRLRDGRQTEAWGILKKWADIESSGKLASMSETALEGEFVTEVFGKALGYTLFSENEDHWNLRQKFSVNGGQADAVIGTFQHSGDEDLCAIIELKGPKTNIDRDRSNGRTAVQQCWDYLNARPDCSWGIVCNYVSFRLYHRERSNRSYQLFVLQDLAKEDVFREFYYLLERAGLIPSTAAALSRADSLLKATGERQMEVGDDLYQSYDQNRRKLIRFLTKAPQSRPRENSIRIAQKLLDRVMFIAFCEDRGLLPEHSIAAAYHNVPPFARITNPRWQNFLDLFRSVDEGNSRRDIAPFNGGLFREDPEVDNLNLDDAWTDVFYNMGKYDFRDEVNVDVLGHLFERSIRDIGIIRLGGLFGGEDDDGRPRMSKSAERKRFGIYYTPPEFTRFITHNTVRRLIGDRQTNLAKKHGLDLETYLASKPSKKHAKFWWAGLSALRNIKVVDPACGSGAFLIAAYDVLEEKYLDIVDQLRFHDPAEAEALIPQIPTFILKDNLYGVDLSQEAVEITQLALWIRSARPGQALSDLSENIVCGNSLVSDREIHERAMVWEDQFPDVFDRPEAGFDCVIGNPPWERLKLQEREFFDAVDPDIATAVSAAERKKLIGALEKANPELYLRYRDAKAAAEKTLDHVRNSGRFPLTGKGDINTYAVFAELAHSIVSPGGRVGLLVPSGIATDHTTRDFFATLTDSRVLAGLYDFENKAPVFADVDRRFKFCVLFFGGALNQTEAADYVFFAHRLEELGHKNRHIALSAADIKLLNPNTNTCPIFRSNRDADLTKAIYHRVPVLVDRSRKEAGNPWGIKFQRMLDQTNDAELFKTADWFAKNRYQRKGASWHKGKQTFLPLYEAKMIQMYDHRAAGVVVKDDNWMRQGQTMATDLVQHQNTEFSAIPRWWVNEKDVLRSLGGVEHDFFIGFKDISSSTNQRTVIASAIPWSAVTNHFPLLIGTLGVRLQLCLLANLNSLAFDFVARQKMGAVTLNFFIVEQLPVFSPDTYSQGCPWDQGIKLQDWISERVLKLTCTSDDMAPLAKAAGFEPSVHKWNPAERAELQAELDAAYSHLYGLKRDDVQYVLTTFSGLAKEDAGLSESTSAPDLILKQFDRLRE